MKSNATEQAILGVVSALATTAMLALAGVVSRAPANDKEFAQLHGDVARIEERCARIESLLLERK